MMSKASGCAFHKPRLISTEVPGQFPVCTFAPVSALNKVDLPEFGAPTNARTGVPSFAMRMAEVEWQLGAAVFRAIMLPPG